MGTQDQPIPYVQPLLDAVGLFEELKLGYALVGGIAAMYYGRSRFTEDLDFVVVTGHTDVLAAHADVLRRYHFDPTCIWKRYHESGMEIDIWKDERADAIVSGARSADLGGRKVQVADPHDLIAMKLRAGRIQDDYDISEIIRRQPIDESLIKSRVTNEQYEHFEAVRRRW